MNHETPSEEVKKLYALALKLGRKRTADSYLKRFPELDKKPESKITDENKEMLRKEDPYEEPKVKKHGKKSKR